MNSRFVKYLQPLLYIGKILGIVYFPTNNETTKVTNFLWFLPLITAYSYCIIKSAPKFWTVRYKQSNDVIEMGDLFVIIVCCINVAVRIICNIKNRQRTTKMLERIVKIDEILNVQETHTSYKWLIILILMEISKIVRDTYFIASEVGAIGVYMYFISSTNYYISFIETYLIYEIIGKLMNQLRVINGKLVNYIANKQRNINVIENIAQIHYELITTAKLTNSIYGVNILGVFTCNFVKVTSCVHYCSLLLRLVITKEKLGPIDYVVCVADWSILMVLQIIIVVATWTSLSIEAKRTATYIHDIWNKCANENRIDSNINHLQLISLQLLNSELHFTAFGFFPLDWTLIHAIVGAVATYVVILIQFEMA